MKKKKGESDSIFPTALEMNMQSRWIVMPLVETSSYEYSIKEWR